MIFSASNTKTTSSSQLSSFLSSTSGWLLLTLTIIVQVSALLDNGDANNINSDRQGFVGCLFSEHLCNADEVCFDDSVFGRCVSVRSEETAASDNDDDDLYRFDTLSEEESDFLELELKKLKDDGFSWSDDYAQCVILTALNTVRYNSDFDLGLCNRLIVTADSDSEDRLEKRTNDESNNEEEQQQVEIGEQQPIQKSFKVWTDNPSDPHAFFYKASAVANGSPNYYVTREEDGGILIDPQEPDSVSSEVKSNSFAQSYNIFPDNNNNNNDFVEVEDDDEQQLSPRLDDESGDDLIVREVVDPYDLFDNLQFGGPIDHSGISGELIENGNTGTFMEPESGSLDIETRAMETPELLLGLDDSDTFNRHKFGYVKRSQSDSNNDDDDDKNLSQDEENEKSSGKVFDVNDNDVTRESEGGDEPQGDDNSGEVEGNPEYFFIPSDGDSGERFIFNRNERFDVKKPGPFFPNSANNFFLNKIISEEEDGTSDAQDGILLKDPFGPKDKNAGEEKGQIEVEQPLLAPVKDKRILPVVESAIHDRDEDNNFVHIALNKRLQTWMQGSDLIGQLAQELDIPEHALTDRLIEDQHVQFRVEPNPQNLDAENMANVLGNNIEIQKRLEDQLGVDIKKVVAGHQHDFEKALGSVDANLLLGVTLALATTTVLVLSALGLILIKRRRKQMRIKQNQIEQEEEDSRLRDQYSQLCRDWSSTTKPTDGVVEVGDNPHGKPTSTSGIVSDTKTTTTETKKISSRNGSKELEESNRSSTSSWPDEPTASNMDISTGHMVLAYMEDHLKNKQRLEQEWVALCGYEAEPCATAVAFKAENKKKNRYPDKLPYDHNRVILNALLNKSNSDYINASTVTDHDPRNPPYIVTQGPLSQTVADFWQMVWEQGCVVIVMLTRLQDNGYHLCHRYWPEEGSEKYHIFEVHLVSEHVWCDDYLVRSVYLKNTRTGETRTVTQFHFRSWPAQGVPTSTKALLEFRRKVNKSYRGRSCPIIVHCSDGVGRAGTYILIDMVLNRMSKGCKEIDIAATLEHIRDQRGGMVQTRQQFEFCLMAVAEEVHAILKALPQ